MAASQLVKRQRSIWGEDVKSVIQFGNFPSPHRRTRIFKPQDKFSGSRVWFHRTVLAALGGNRGQKINTIIKIILKRKKLYFYYTADLPADKKKIHLYQCINIFPFEKLQAVQSVNAVTLIMSCPRIQLICINLL